MSNVDTRSMLGALLAGPFVLFAGYIAYLVVPAVVRVVPIVVRAVIGA